MRSMGKIFSFSAAHHLPHHDGLCQEHHGHNYRLEVEIGREVYVSPVQEYGPAKGMIMDFNDLTAIVSEIILNHDHKDLNTMYDNPTAEIMIEAIAEQIKRTLPNGFILLTLKLWETERCYAKWTTY